MGHDEGRVVASVGTSVSSAPVIDLAEARAAEERREAIATLHGQLAKSEKFAVLGILSNLILIIANDPVLAGLCGYDDFTSAPVIHRPAPSPIEGAPPQPGPYPRPWTAADVSHLQSYLQRVWTKQASKGETEDAMLAVAASWRFHPIKDWLASLWWDGQPRLGDWLHSAFGAPKDDYHTAVATNFLIAAIRRVRCPGCKFDHMPILEGGQGIGKSKAVRLLFGSQWFTDSLPAALESRDAALGLQGAWCIEFAEIEQIIRTEVEVIKAFLSRSVDRFRAPYGRSFLTYPRQSVMIGTTNDSEYLRDATGNRRFWPVKCETVDTDWIIANRDQLWAEAANREEFGEGHWIQNVEVNARADQIQADRHQEDVWEDKISAVLIGRNEVTTSELLSNALSIPTGQQGKREQMRVAGILKQQGWIRAIARDGSGVVTRKWKRGW